MERVLKILRNGIFYKRERTQNELLKDMYDSMSNVNNSQYTDKDNLFADMQNIISDLNRSYNSAKLICNE